MFVLLKSMMISGRLKLGPAAVTAESTVEKVELTFTPRLTSLEMPVEASVPWLSIDDVPVFATVNWLNAVDAPVDTTVAMLVPDESADETEVTADLTLDIPTVAVDSELEVSSQMLFSAET